MRVRCARHPHARGEVEAGRVGAGEPQHGTNLVGRGDRCSTNDKAATALAELQAMIRTEKGHRLYAGFKTIEDELGARPTADVPVQLSPAGGERPVVRPVGPMIAGFPSRDRSTVNPKRKHIAAGLSG